MPWPSSYAVGTLGYMIDRIDMELMRNGTINDRIQLSISDAIQIYEKERFRFNETFTASFLTTVGQQNYTSITDTSFGSVATFQDFLSIDWVTITIPPAVFDLPKIQPEQLLVLTQTGTQLGQPYCYAFMNETLMLYPIPSSGGPGQINQFNFTAGTGYTSGFYTNATLTGGTGNGATANLNVVAGTVTTCQLINPGTQYQIGDVLSCTSIGPGSGFTLTVTAITSSPPGPYRITCGGQIKLAAPAALDTTGNKWMTDGERLIRSRAKYELSLHLTRNMTMAQMMSPEEPTKGSLPGATWAAYRELKVEGVRMAQRGVIAPMAF